VGRRGELKSLGMDVELAEPLPDNILRIISDDTERSQCSIDLPRQQHNLGTLIFCAKEAFYKCYYPLTATALDFLDVSVHFSESKENGRGEFYASLKRPDHRNLPQGSNLKGRWYIADGLIFAGATLT
jgi:4'-phosphopantetheinyl transferase EntD